MYGTSKKAVRDVAEQNKICILDIDEQGVKNLKKISDINPLFCFIKPPSIEILEERLRGRGTETEESFQKRCITAKSANLAFLERTSTARYCNIHLLYSKLYSYICKSFD